MEIIFQLQTHAKQILQRQPGRWALILHCFKQACSMISTAFFLSRFQTEAFVGPPQGCLWFITDLQKSTSQFQRKNNAQPADMDCGGADTARWCKYLCSSLGFCTCCIWGQQLDAFSLYFVLDQQVLIFFFFMPFPLFRMYCMPLQSEDRWFEKQAVLVFSCNFVFLWVKLLLRRFV